MRKFIITILSVGISVIGFAQGTFKFEEESYDFGNIKEGDKADHVFKFTNTGNEPIVITKVKASCGCTTPFWSKDPIPPGGTGEIKASYNSLNRPGGFHKSITITSNAKSPSKVLRINGVAQKKPDKVFTDAERLASPRIRIVDNDHNFGNIQIGQRVSKKFTVTNFGKSDLNISNLKSRCNCVTFVMDKKPLKPGESGTMTVSFKPRAIGENKEMVKVQSNDIITPIVNLSLRGIVKQSTDNQSIIQNSNKITF